MVERAVRKVPASSPKINCSTNVQTIVTVLGVVHPRATLPSPKPQNSLLATRAMEKRKAMSSDLKGPEVANALHALNNLRDVILREQQLKQEADGGEGGEKEVLEKLGDLISLLDPEPFVSCL